MNAHSYRLMRLGTFIAGNRSLSNKAAMYIGEMLVRFRATLRLEKTYSPLSLPLKAGQHTGMDRSCFPSLLTEPFFHPCGTTALCHHFQSTRRVFWQVFTNHTWQCGCNMLSRVGHTSDLDSTVIDKNSGHIAQLLRRLETIWQLFFKCSFGASHCKGLCIRSM